MSSYLYCETPISPKWARQVKRHQRALMARLHTPAKDPPTDRDPPLPQTIADLVRPSKDRSRICTSINKGVLKARHQNVWIAYRPETNKTGRKVIGHGYPTDRAAADAVLHEINPDAPPTPPEELL